MPQGVGRPAQAFAARAAIARDSGPIRSRLRHWEAARANAFDYTRSPHSRQRLPRNRIEPLNRQGTERGQ